MGWFSRRKRAPEPIRGEALNRLLQPPRHTCGWGCGPDDPDVKRTVQALLASGDISGTDLAGWESVEVGIRRNERKRLAGLLESEQERHSDEDNFCTEADIAWDRALYVVKEDK